MMRTQRLLSLVSVWLVLVGTGCSSIPFFSHHKYVESDARHPVMETLCIWESAEGRGTDNLPCRGFAGQVLFFANGYKQPVKVSGDVRIYVFDNEGVEGDASKPLHQFDFPAEVWNTFLTPSNLGTTYQIFIPYTRKGHHAASCTLRVRFTPEGGLPVYSKMATVELTGDASEAPVVHKDDQIITAAAAIDRNAGQGVVTSDWSQLLNDPQAVADSVKHPTPGISLGATQASAQDGRTLDRLRLAAQEASSSPAVLPRTDSSAGTAGSRLRPLISLKSNEFGAIQNRSLTESASPASHDPSLPVPTKQRHPLDDSESE